MFDAFGHGGVAHETDVGAVNAHAESYGGDDDVDFFADEALLVFVALFVGEAGVVGQVFVAGSIQFSGDVVYVFAAQAVDDAGFFAVFFQYFNELGDDVLPGHDAVSQVGAVN